MIKKINIKIKGFSTVEVLATALVFSIAAVAIAGITARSIQLQRRAVATQKIQENALFILEYIAREIRVSSVRNQNSNCTATILSLSHPINGSVTYNLVNGALVRTADGVATILSTNDVQFSQMYFCIQGSDLGDGLPTRITISAKIVDRGIRPLATVDLQTTITSRVISN